MAKKISQLDNYNLPTSSNPDGSLKDRVYAGDGVTVEEEGSRVLAPYVQDLLNPFHKFGRAINQFLSGVADTQTTGQYFKWLAANIMHRGGNYYLATTVGNIDYTLTRPLGWDDSPMVYKEGLMVRFVVPGSNSSNTMRVNVAGVGWKDVAESFLEAGDPPTVTSGSLAEGDVVRLLYVVRSSDSFGYFRVVRTSLNQLDVGDVDLVTGSAPNIFKLKLGLNRLEQYFSGSGFAKTINYNDDYFQGQVFDTTNYWYSKIDYLNAAFESILNGGSWGYIRGKLQAQGLRFINGPNSATTDPVFWRPQLVEYPLGAASFVPVRNGWQAQVPDSGGVFYYLDTEVPAGQKIFSAYAMYTCFDGSIRGAPCRITDSSGTSTPSNSINIIILSDDSSAPTGATRPLADSGSEFVRVSLWYDGVSLPSATPLT